MDEALSGRLLISHRKGSGVTERDGGLKPRLRRRCRARGAGGEEAALALRGQVSLRDGKSKPSSGCDGCGDCGCFLVTCLSSCHLSAGLSVLVRFPAVLGAVGVCFGPGRALLGQLCFRELP